MQQRAATMEQHVGDWFGSLGWLQRASHGHHATVYLGVGVHRRVLQSWFAMTCQTHVLASAHDGANHGAGRSDYKHMVTGAMHDGNPHVRTSYIFAPMLLPLCLVCWRSTCGSCCLHHAASTTVLLHNAQPVTFSTPLAGLLLAQQLL